MAVREWVAAGGSAVTGGGPKALNDRDAHMIREALRKMGLKQWKLEKLGGDYAKQYELVARTTIEGLGSMGIAIDRPDPVAVQIIELGINRHELVDIEAQTAKAIREAIAAGRADGLNPKAIERLIREKVEGGPSRSVSTRALRIARTETLHAQRASTLASLGESGAFATVIAFDNLLGHDDDECAERDGQEFTLAEAEGIEDHPNGTLSWAPGALA